MPQELPHNLIWLQRGCVDLLAILATCSIENMLGETFGIVVLESSLISFERDGRDVRVLDRLPFLSRHECFGDLCGFTERSQVFPLIHFERANDVLFVRLLLD